MRRAILDLRSDTVTTPLKEMYEAMMTAPVGDDVYGDDPSVNKLEEEAALITGKQAGLFVPSGTMGNLLAVMSHCKGRGSEMIVGDRSHMALYEAGSSASIGGVFSRILPTRTDGTLDLDEIRNNIQSPDIHHSVTQLICLENTHNVCGGVPLSAAYCDAVGAIAREHGIKLHIDGARLFNASVALACPVKQLVAAADSVMFCLSKGLAAPVGSMLVGDKEMVARARYFRKMLGGGMRQVGVIASAGRVALSVMPSRLATDHEVAKLLASELAKNASIEMEYVPQSNLMHFVLKKSVTKRVDQIVKELEELGVRVCGEPVRWRLATHYQITRESVPLIVEAFDQVLNKN